MLLREARVRGPLLRGGRSLRGRAERPGEFLRRAGRGDPVRKQQWDAYLEDLAITVTNLRTAFDCNIIIGGDVGGYLAERLTDLYPYLRRYHKLDSDTAYIKVGHYKRQSSALGAARQMIELYLNNFR
jgi:predicted NBD/HSP70 family sugar kinase